MGSSGLSRRHRRAWGRADLPEEVWLVSEQGACLQPQGRAAGIFCPVSRITWAHLVTTGPCSRACLLCAVASWLGGLRGERRSRAHAEPPCGKRSGRGGERGEGAALDSPELLVTKGVGIRSGLFKDVTENDRQARACWHHQPVTTGISSCLARRGGSRTTGRQRKVPVHKHGFMKTLFRERPLGAGAGGVSAGPPPGVGRAPGGAEESFQRSHSCEEAELCFI